MDRANKPQNTGTIFYVYPWLGKKGSKYGDSFLHLPLAGEIGVSSMNLAMWLGLQSFLPFGPEPQFAAN